MKVPSIYHSARASSPLPGFLVFFLTCYGHSMESAQCTVVGLDRPVMAVMGKDIMLPCQLATKMSAENMNVTWFQSQLSPFVHRYSNRKDQYEQQMPEYQGRTELLRDGLSHGNVTLKIFPVRLSDQGWYNCSVQNGTFCQNTLLELKVADPFFPKVYPWKVTLGVTLVVLLGSFALIVYLFKIKEQQAAELRWRRLAFPVEEAYVTLDPDTAHPNLILSMDRKCVKWRHTQQPLPDFPEKFDYWFCVLGREGFTSGRHYWEVEVEVGDGRNWGVGVARESVSRKGRISLSPKGGIWAVRRRWYQFQALTDPATPLPLRSPSRIRVCLDCDQGQVTFIDARTEAPIFSFPPGSLPGERIRPWLGVWGKDTELQLCP